MELRIDLKRAPQIGEGGGPQLLVKKQPLFVFCFPLIQKTQKHVKTQRKLNCVFCLYLGDVKDRLS